MEIIDYVVLNNFPNFIFINFLNLIFNILLIHKIVVPCVDEKNFVKYIVIGILITELLLFFLISKFINKKTKYLKIYYLKNNFEEITKSKKEIINDIINKKVIFNDIRNQKLVYDDGYIKEVYYNYTFPITKEEFDVIKKCQKEFNKSTLKMRKEKYLKTKTGNVNFID
jgi:hypothetical protein